MASLETNGRDTDVSALRLNSPEIFATATPLHCAWQVESGGPKNWTQTIIQVSWFFFTFAFFQLCIHVGFTFTGRVLQLGPRTQDKCHSKGLWFNPRDPGAISSFLPVSERSSETSWHSSSLVCQPSDLRFFFSCHSLALACSRLLSCFPLDG